MIVIILVLIALLVGGLLAATIFWISLQRRQAFRGKEPSPEPLSKSTAFHWKYVALPVALFIISVIITALFYPGLPGEVAYHFSDGAPDRWTSRDAIVIWMLLPQFFFALLAFLIVWVAAKISALFHRTGNTGIGRTLSLMGNMVALPQLVLGFAMLDIFSYNSYGVRLLPLWVFALIVMALGVVVLSTFFLGAFQQARRSKGK